MTDIPIPEFVLRLEENLASFDAEVAHQLSIEGERADLWDEIDVNVEDLRSLIADRAAQAERMARLEEALRRAACPRPCNGLPDDFEVGQCVDADECGCCLGDPLMTPAIRPARALSQEGSDA